MKDETELLEAELGDLLVVEDGLSAWTIGFIESLIKQARPGRTFSRRQAAKIHELWDAHCK